ncbi:MAG TPA: hypothetical protein VNG33_23880, partial [Polyangiaceae bacterium]|nr:hypothetical protein [Polyangiaceae bacterium]
LNQDFAPRAVEHPDLAEEAFQMAWVGDRAVVLETGSYADVPDARGWSARYLWVDAESGAATDLGYVPSLTTGDAGISRDPEQASIWASPVGAVFVDHACNLVYLEKPSVATTLLSDCSAQAAWSGDASFLVVTTDTERTLYEQVDGQLRRVELASPVFVQSFKSHWQWAPSAPRFVIYDGGGSVDTHLTSLVYGDARSAELHAFPNLPPLNYVSFATDRLLIASDWSGDKYALDVSQLSPNDEAALVPLGLADNPDSLLIASRDSSRLYFTENPFNVLELSKGQPTQSEILFTESRPVAQVKFRLLDDDNAGLLTMIEPERKPVGGGDASSFEPHHQYLLNLGSERAVIPLGSFNLAAGTDALGIRTFQSAPQFGGIFYVGSSADQLYVDWLGFDDISHKRRLLDFASSLAGVDMPASVTPNAP